MPDVIRTGLWEAPAWHRATTFTASPPRATASCRFPGAGIAPVSRRPRNAISAIGGHCAAPPDSTAARTGCSQSPPGQSAGGCRRSMRVRACGFCPPARCRRPLPERSASTQECPRRRASRAGCWRRTCCPQWLQGGVAGFHAGLVEPPPRPPPYTVAGHHQGAHRDITRQGRLLPGRCRAGVSAPQSEQLSGRLCQFQHAVKRPGRRRIGECCPGACDSAAGIRRGVCVPWRTGCGPAFRARPSIPAVPADVGARLAAIRYQEGQRERDAAYGALGGLQRPEIPLRGRRWFRQRQMRTLFRSCFLRCRHNW